MKKQNWLPLAIWVVLFIVFLQFIGNARREQVLRYATFKQQLQAGKVINVNVDPGFIQGEFRGPGSKAIKFRTILPTDPELLAEMEQRKVVQSTKPAKREWLMPFLLNWGPMVILVVFWLFMIKSRKK